MRYLCLYVFLFLFLIYNIYNNHVFQTSPTPSFPLPLPLSSQSGENRGLFKTKDVLNTKVFLDEIILQLLILLLLLIFLLYQAWLHTCRKTYYVPFETNLSLLKKNKYSPTLTMLMHITWYTSASILVLVISECKTNSIYFLLVTMKPNLELNSCTDFIFYLLLKFRKTIQLTLSMMTAILIFSHS